jgi:hypothetical protein
MAKLPSFQFYPGDWMKDPLLRCVSAAGRGLWIDLLCLMFESAHRGFLELPNGEPMTAIHLGRMTGVEHGEVQSLLQELETAGVFSRTERGTIYSRRMLRDESKRVKCTEAGKRGGNPTLKGQSKGGGKGDDNGQSKGESKRNPTPSSSSSSSEEDLSHITTGERDTFLTGPSTAFEQFMEIYPRKMAPAKAWRVWQSVVIGLSGTRGLPDEEIETWLVKRGEAYACSPSGQPPPPGQTDDFRPSPAKWLEDGKYDEPAAEWFKPNIKANSNGKSQSHQRAHAGNRRAAAERSGDLQDLDALLDSVPIRKAPAATSGV